jgi:hypothetical protein
MKEPDKLKIEYIPKDGGRSVFSDLQVSQVQSVEFELPSGYDIYEPITIYSDQFQKMAKELSVLSKNIKAMASRTTMRFEIDGVYKQLQVNTVYDEDDYKDEVIDSKEIYNANFSSANISKFVKMSKLHTTMKVYAISGQPLLFEIPIGGLGNLKVYVKSNEEIEKEDELDGREDDNDGEEYISI